MAPIEGLNLLVTGNPVSQLRKHDTSVLRASAPHPEQVACHYDPWPGEPCPACSPRGTGSLKRRTPGPGPGGVWGPIPLKLLEGLTASPRACRRPLAKQGTPCRAKVGAVSSVSTFWRPPRRAKKMTKAPEGRGRGTGMTRQQGNPISGRGVFLLGRRERGAIGRPPPGRGERGSLVFGHAL